jgi:hypothetical protein
MFDSFINFVRTYSFFEPTFTYNVVVNDPLTGVRTIGAVARNEGGRKWYASNKTWTGGADLPGTFPTRRDAAWALVHQQTEAR